MSILKLLNLVIYSEKYKSSNDKMYLKLKWVEK